jgi:hypothetical protein
MQHVEKWNELERFIRGMERTLTIRLLFQKEEETRKGILESFQLPPTGASLVILTALLRIKLLNESGENNGNN